MVDRRLRWIFLGDEKDLRQATKAAEKDLKGVEKQSGRTRKGFDRLGRGVGLAAGAFAAAGIGSWVKESADLARNAELVGKSFEETFGPASRRLRDELDQQRRALGLGSDQLDKQLLRFGQLATAMGISRDEAADFSARLFTMAGDVAAFNGELDNSEAVLDAFASGLKGEFDALEAFGIKINQAAVNNRALADSGKESADQLTEQEKAAATVALITDQLGDEFGALAEAQDTNATKTNELLAEMRDLQVDGGEAFATIEDALNGFLLAIIRGLRSLGKPIADFIRWLDEIGEKGIPVLSSIAKGLSTVLKWLFGIKRIPNPFSAVTAGLRGFWDWLGRTIGRLGDIADRVRNLPSTLGGILGFQTGGTVPGPTGSPQLAVVHGGEEVLTPAQSRARRMGRDSGGGGGGSISITVNTGVGDPVAIGQAIIEVLQQYERTNGPLPIQIRDA